MNVRLPAGQMHDLYDYWRAISQNDELPDRKDLDPAAIPRILPHFYLLDVLDGGERFSFRLTGTAIVETLGFDPTGKQLSDIIFGVYLAFMRDLFQRCVSVRRAIFSESGYQYPGKDYLSVRRLLLPFRAGGEAVEIILVYQDFQYADDIRRRPFHAVLESASSGEVSYTMESFEL